MEPAAISPPSMTTPRSLFSRSQVEVLQAAYRDIFPELTPAMREYWDLDRKRAWCSLPSDFHRASFEHYEEATRRALEIERTVTDGLLKGHALHQITLDLGVGLSIGPGPWSDICLHETYERNIHKRRATVLVMSDCYPIAPSRSKNAHPVEAPLRYDRGIWGVEKYKRNGGMPKAIELKDELLVFLNYIPDYRPPLEPTTCSFKTPYGHNKSGFMAVLHALLVRFDDVKLITYGRKSWEDLRIDVVDLPEPLSITGHAKSAHGRGKLLTLPIGQHRVPYLPLAHPTDARNFTTEHAEHAHLGFLALGLGGASCRS
jgi:hypothetical protein